MDTKGAEVVTEKDIIINILSEELIQAKHRLALFEELEEVNKQIAEIENRRAKRVAKAELIFNIILWLIVLLLVCVRVLK